MKDFKKATSAEKIKAPWLYGHVAVRLQNYVLLFAGIPTEDARCKDFMHLIWSYNLYTEQWRKYRIPELKSIPHMELYGASAVAIGTDVYMFGGRDLYMSGTHVSNDLWQLTINKNRCFTWTKMPQKVKSETPSPRRGHSGWVYMEKMWIFGGCGISPSLGFLNEHGDETGVFNINNQLLCYDPCNNTWTNPKCFGDVPCPRIQHATAIIRNKVFLYGGCQDNLFDCFCMMNMDTLSWTMIKTNQPNPGPREGFCLTAVTDYQLVLYGGSSTGLLASDDTWIFDIKNGLWKQYTRFKGHVRWYHTGTRGLANSVFITGGLKLGTIPRQKIPTSHLLLEPKSLQQLAMYIIYQHMDMLPWKSLPTRIMNQLMDPAQDEEPDL